MRIIVISFILTFILTSCKFGVSDEEFKNNYSVSSIHVMNIDGTNERALTNSNSYVLYANYLPNGRKIVFVRTRDLISDHPADYLQTLYIMDNDGSNTTPIVSKNICFAGTYPPLQTYYEFVPRIQFTKDSKKIVFSTWYDRESCTNIWSINIDGSNLTNITNLGNSGAILGSFSLSNDDQKIVYNEFHADFAQTNYIVTRNIDGTNPKIIKTLHGIKTRFPRFLPTDNNTIVYLEDINNVNSFLKRVSATDTSVSATIAPFQKSVYYPLLMKTNKLIYFAFEYPNSGLYELDLASGANQPIYKNIGAWLVSASPDQSLLTWSDDHKFGILNSNGTVVKDSLSPFYECREPYISPSNQQVIFRSISSVRY